MIISQQETGLFINTVEELIMPNIYYPKAISTNKLERLRKNLEEETTSDRQKALEAYEYFKGIVDTWSGDPDQGQVSSAAQKCMVECLRLAQDSRIKLIRILEVIQRFQQKISATGNNELEEKTLTFDELNQ